PGRPAPQPFRQRLVITGQRQTMQRREVAPLDARLEVLGHGAGAEQHDRPARLRRVLADPQPRLEERLRIVLEVWPPQDVAIEYDRVPQRARQTAAHGALAAAARARHQQQRRADEGMTMTALGTDGLAM